jgi:Leucine-rich repeat (LRR) protein
MIIELPSCPSLNELDVEKRCTASDGTDGIQLFDHCYSIDNTNEIILDNLGSEMPVEIPPEICVLTNLELLGLYDVSGTIPPEIGHLINLRRLVLGYHLNGEIPSTIGNLTKLHVLSLARNQLGCYEYDYDCEPGFDNSITDCCITHCDETDECSGAIPSTIGNMTNLGVWQVPWYDPAMSGPGGMGMDEWWALDLRSNCLSGLLPPGLGNLIEIPQVNLGGNRITGPIPVEIANMIGLVVMNLSFNELSCEVPPELGDLPNMSGIESSFNLGNNNLTGQIPEELCNINIGLYGNEFCPPFPDCYFDGRVIPQGIVGDDIPDGAIYCNPYPDCPDGYIGIPGQSPYSFISYDIDIGAFGYDQTVYGTYGGGCFYQDDLDVLQELIDLNPELGNIDVLELGRQKWFSYKYNSEPTLWGYYVGGPDAYQNHGRLCELNLSDFPITAFPESMGNLTKLQELVFNNTQLSSIPAVIGDLPELERLYSKNGMLTGPIPPELGNISTLRRMIFTNNQLTGSIPPELGNLSKLTSLYLDDNQLSGSIPPELGNMTYLLGLRLQDNQFTGSIPAELGNCDLQWMDLSRNQLTGEVPMEIWTMDAFTSSGHPFESQGESKRRIYLRENNLTGVMPESMCDINLKWRSYGYIDLRDNEFCPPHPSCLNNRMGQQDISNCD